MSAITSIEWTDRTWNPVRGCSRVSEGCRNCYAERFAGRFAGVDGYMHGFVANHSADHDAGGFAKWRWTGKVELMPEKLAEPLSWRKPQRVFVNSMSDLFHESLPFEHTLAIFGAMAACPHLTFQVLTKRPAHMREVLGEMRSRLQRSGRFAHPALAEHAAVIAMKLGAPESTASDRLFKAANRCAGRGAWPLPNVWLGVSVEDQTSAEERIPILLETPAAVRFVSAEPLLGPIEYRMGWISPFHDLGPDMRPTPRIDQTIIGGESGPSARPCEVAWIRDLVEQLRHSEGTRSTHHAVFVKQLGANSTWRVPKAWLAFNGAAAIECEHGYDACPTCDAGSMPMRDRKGGDIAEWPEDLRVREFPQAVRA